jgi:hypothetical protein
MTQGRSRLAGSPGNTHQLSQEHGHDEVHASVWAHSIAGLCCTRRPALPKGCQMPACTCQECIPSVHIQHVTPAEDKSEPHTQWGMAWSEGITCGPPCFLLQESPTDTKQPPWCPLPSTLTQHMCRLDETSECLFVTMLISTSLVLE